MLNDIIVLKKGKKPNSISNEPFDSCLPYVDIKSFETGIVDKYTNGENCVKCSNEDLLIVCDGSRSGLVGKAIDGYVGSTLARIDILNSNIDKDYLYYFLQSKYVILNKNVKGTGTPHLKQDLLKSFEIYLPDVQTQKRIVTQIEESLSQLDSAVETLKKTKQQLEDYRDTVLKSAFTGSYPCKPLAEISKAISGYAFKSKLYDNSGRYRVVKIGNVKPFHFDFSRDNTCTNEFDERIIEKYLLKQGDCIITLTGSRGKRDYGFVAMINEEKDYMLNQRVAALRFDISIAYPKFFMYYLSSIDYRNKFFSYETGNVGQGNVGIKALIEPEVIVPSLQEQKRIVKRIESQLSVCDCIEQTVNQSLQQAEALRQSILKKAFSYE